MKGFTDLKSQKNKSIDTVWLKPPSSPCIHHTASDRPAEGPCHMTVTSDQSEKDFHRLKNL